MKTLFRGVTWMILILPQHSLKCLDPCNVLKNLRELLKKYSEAFKKDFNQNLLMMEQVELIF